MISEAIIVTSIWLGYEIVSAFSPDSFDQLDILAGGIPVGITIITWIYFILRNIISLTAKLSVFISAITALIAYLVHIKIKRRIYFRAIRIEFIVTFFFMTAIVLRLTDICILKYGTTSGCTVFSDLPVHMSLITSFAYGGNSLSSKMITPFYAGETLCYPIIPDFFSTILVKCGKCSIRYSISVPTVILFMSILLTIHSLAQIYSSSRFVPELAIIFFVFAGGVGWKYAFVKECARNPNFNAIHYLCARKSTFWIHSLVHFIMPQRSALFSMPLCIMITLLLINSVIKENMREWKTLFLAGLMMGLLPMNSAHSYIGVGEYAIFLCIFNFPWIKPYEWAFVIIKWAIFGGTAIILSLPQVIMLTSSKRTNFMKIDPIWTETESGHFGFFKMWWKSLGTFAVMSLVCCWPLIKEKQFKMYIPSVFVWTISNFIRYQPGAMDNTKVYYAGWYTLACAVVANYIIVLWTHSKNWYKWMVRLVLIGVIFGSSASSMICIYRGVTHEFLLYQKYEKDMGIWTMDNTKPDAIFFGSDWHCAPTMAYAGRILMMGYNGWVWSHGLSTAKRYNEMNELRKQINNPKIWYDKNILYAVSRWDNKKNPFPPPPLYSQWVKVFDCPSAQIYRVVQK